MSVQLNSFLNLEDVKSTRKPLLSPREGLCGLLRPHTSCLPTQELSNLSITPSNLHRQSELSNRIPVPTCSILTRHIVNQWLILRSYLEICAILRDR